MSKTKYNWIITLSASALALGLAGTALAEEKTAGRELAQVVFDSIDVDGSDDVTAEEIGAFGMDAYVSMDSDENGTVNQSEFMEWGFGFSNIAEDQSNVQGYRTAQKIIFDLWDRDNDGEWSGDEQVYSARMSFDYADLDGDQKLSREEYLQGYIFNIAYRAALRQE